MGVRVTDSLSKLVQGQPWPRPVDHRAAVGTHQCQVRELGWFARSQLVDRLDVMALDVAGPLCKDGRVRLEAPTGSII